MSSDQPRRGRESTGSPLGSTAAIIIAIVAVVAGFLILRQIRDDDGGTGTTVDPISSVSDSLPDGSAGTTDAGTGDTVSTLAPETVAPTLAPETTPTTVFVTEGAIVVVANASTVNGAAGQLTTALTGKGFDLSAATNATTKLDVSKIYYDPANAQAQAVAQTVALLMAVTEILPIESPAPVEGGSVPDGVSVLVMLGSDKASKTLDQMSQPVTATTLAGETTTTTA